MDRQKKCEDRIETKKLKVAGYSSLLDGSEINSIMWIAEEGSLCIDLNTKKPDEAPISFWIPDADVFLDNLAELIEKHDWFVHSPILIWKRRRNDGEPMHGKKLKGVGEIGR